MRRKLYYTLLKIELLIIIGLLFAILLVSVWNGCTRHQGSLLSPAEGSAPQQGQEKAENGYAAIGFASFYDNAFHGRLTASGEVYDKDELTAAHRELPFHTRVRVTNLETGDQAVVRIIDRGPYDEARLLDVSEKAAKMLNIVDDGVARVKLEVVE